MEEFRGTVQEAGALVRRNRKARGLNQTELAKMAGVSRKFVSEFEQGHPRAEINKSLRLLGTVGIKVRFLETSRPTEPVQIDLTEHKRRYSSSVIPGSKPGIRS